MMPFQVSSVEPQLDHRDLLTPETRARLEALEADKDRLRAEVEATSKSFDWRRRATNAHGGSGE